MTLLGVLTAGLAIAPVLGFEYYAADYQVIRPHTVTLAFVIPIFTVFIGFLGSSGYYFGARIMHYRPEKLVLMNMCIFAVLLLLAVHWLEYELILAGLGIIPDTMSFGEVLYRDVFESSLELRTKSGRGGRALDSTLLSVASSVVLLAGYLFGACCIYGILRSLPYCQHCRQFMKVRTKQIRYPSSRLNIDNPIAVLQGLRDQMDEGLLADLIEDHTALPAKKELRQSRWRSILWHKECGGCGADCLEYPAYFYGRKGWDDHEERFQIYLSQQLQLET